MANSSKSPGCFGCLGILVLLSCLGSLFFGGGVVLRVGTFGLGFNDPTKIDRQQIITDYWIELENEQKIAQKAVDNFRMQLKSGQCEEAYNQASDILKKSTPKSTFLNLCLMPQKLGDFKSTQSLGWFGQSDNTSNYILMRYSTEFSNFLTQEEFIWRVQHNKAELINYQIFPLDFSNKSTI